MGQRVVWQLCTCPQTRPACPPRRSSRWEWPCGLKPMLGGAFLIMNLPNRAEPPKAPTEPGAGLMRPVPTGASFVGSPVKRPMLPTRNAPRDVLYVRC